jgi:hypothetical protein
MIMFKYKWFLPLTPWFIYGADAAMATRTGFPDVAVRVMVTIGTAIMSIVFLAISQPWKLTKRELEERQ